jgi:8-oxo-dGTP diphosphatase
MKNIATPRVTVDPVVMVYRDGHLKVLLVRRTTAPEKGEWSIPGGHVELNQTLLAAIELSLVKKTSVGIRSMDYVEQLYAFDTTGLDPRGHAISIAFLCLSNRAVIKQPSMAGTPTFFDVQDLPELAFDHISIVRKATQTIRDLLQRTTAASFVLPEYITMSDLHNLYEIVLGRQLDRRNFRKKILALKVLQDSGRLEQNVTNRPGHLYSFRSRNLSDLVHPLD